MSKISRQIETNGAELSAPHYNKPISCTIPIHQEKSVDELFAPWRGQVIYHVDINQPTQAEWLEL